MKINHRERVRAPILWLSCALLLLARPARSSADMGWRMLEKGLEAQVVELKGKGDDPPLVVHLLRVSPRYFNLRVLLASDFGQNSSSVRVLTESSGALGAINTGFFDPDLHPLGLVIARGKTRVPFNKRFHLLREGVFFIRDNQARIMRQSDVDLAGIQEAVQSGPLLVQGGKLAPGLASTSKIRDARSAIGIDRNQNVILLVSSAGREAFTLTELARFLLPRSQISWGCQEALNLDGGNSAQLYLHSRGGTVDVPGLSEIPVALGIFRKPISESSQ